MNESVKNLSEDYISKVIRPQFEKYLAEGKTPEQIRAALFNAGYRRSDGGEFDIYDVSGLLHRLYQNHP